MAKHEMFDLQQMQSLPLKYKIVMSKQRIDAWVNEYGEDNIYISFSGGKDNTVLLDVVRNVCGYKNIEAVYIDTGLEYPEVKQFVKTFENVTIVRPKMTFKEVILKYGYPVISKEQSQYIQQYRNAKSEKTKQTRLYGNKYGQGKISKRWQFLINDDAPKVSEMCCNIMKKNPAKDFEHKTGKHPIIGTMASESDHRLVNWLKYGCNAFELDRPTSRPLSFWTEQDIYKYILENKLEIPSVYGEIIEKDAEQLTLFDSSKEYTTTGCERTGCVFCGYGCHKDKPISRFERLHETHPQLYDYVFKSVDDGGLGYKELLDYMNSHGKVKIKY